MQNNFSPQPLIKTRFFKFTFLFYKYLINVNKHMNLFSPKYLTITINCHLIL